MAKEMLQVKDNIWKGTSYKVPISYLGNSLPPYAVQRSTRICLSSLSVLVEDDAHATRREPVLSGLGADVLTKADMLLFLIS